jgi:hypothetical protein
LSSNANIFGGVEATVMDDRSTIGTARGGVSLRF